MRERPKTHLRLVLDAGVRRRAASAATGPQSPSVAPLPAPSPFPSPTPPPQPRRDLYDPYDGAPHDNRRRPPRPWQRALPKARDEAAGKLEMVAYTPTGEVAWVHPSTRALAGVDWTALAAEDENFGGGASWSSSKATWIRPDSGAWLVQPPDTGQAAVLHARMVDLVNAMATRLKTRPNRFSVLLVEDEFEENDPPVAAELGWHEDGNANSAVTLLIGVTPNALSTQFQGVGGQPISGGSSEPGGAALFRHARHREHHDWAVTGPQMRVLLIISFGFGDVRSEGDVRDALVALW